MKKANHSRRSFILKSLAAVPAIAATAAFAKDADNSKKLVTEIPSNAGLLKGLQYTNKSEKPNQNCANCKLYTPTGDGKGKCQILPKGLVAAEGWCVTWQAKG